MKILEVCCGNLDSVHAAVKGGAPRVELCRALELDGLTPSPDDVRAARERYPALKIHVLIRPRAGDFCYTETEVRQMASEIETALEAGADGIVIGCLTQEGDVDLPAMETLLRTVSDCALARTLSGDACHASNDHHFFENAAAGPSVTFHRAFDVCRQPFRTLEEIIGLGCHRILTSGQMPTASEGVPMIRTLREKARGRIGLLPGCGVTPDNARAILDGTGCTEIHASASATGPDGRKVTSAQTVSAIIKAINHV